MKLSKKSEYGLRAMLDLAAHADEGAVRLKDLADRNNIPLKFLEQIFLTLRNAGVIGWHYRAGGVRQQDRLRAMHLPGRARVSATGGNEPGARRHRRRGGLYVAGRRGLARQDFLAAKISQISNLKC